MSQDDPAASRRSASTRRAAGEGESSAASAGGAVGELHAPLRDVVLREIRQAIIDGRYKPGERLVEERLAADFRVSRNPVREALRSLASEGLIEVTPRHGATVTGLTHAEAREMVEVRATLEGLNARLAARHANPALIEQLKAVLAEGRAKAADGAPEYFVRLNGRFHDLLAMAGSNRTLGDIMRSLRERTARVFAPMSVKQAAQNWEEHAAILRAVIERDEELAALLASRHVLHAGEAYLAEADPLAGQKQG